MNSTTTNDVLKAAKSYAGLGWRVVPVRGKRPICDDWQNRAATTSGEVELLFSVQHDGVGVLLGQVSGIIDLECDSEEAERQLMELFGGTIPETPTFQSTRGKHRLFQWSGDLPDAIVTKAKCMAGAIEVRAGGGGKAAQSVFPPSGKRRWIIDPADVPVAPLPVEVKQRLDEMTATRRKSQPQPVTSPLASDRLDVSRWLASRNVEVLSTDSADGVARWFIRCPGIDRHTTNDNVRDCVVTQGPGGELGGHCFHASCGMTDWQSLKQAIGAPTWSDYEHGTSAVDISAIVEQLSATDEPEPEAHEFPFPADCLYPPGTIGQIVAHTLASSMYPQPQLALAAAITLLGAYTGRKVADVNNTRTNVMTVGLAPTGAGKDAARQINKQIIEAAGLMDLMGSERIGSHAGIINALDKTPAQIMQLDEMGRLFETMKDPRRSPHLFNVVTVLMALYTSSSSTWKADCYADSAKVKLIAQPHLCIYGTSTPDAFWQSLTTSNICEGLMGRLMVFEGLGYDAVEMSEPSIVPLPEQIVETMKRWLEFQPNGLLGSVFPSPVVVKHAPEAYERLFAHLKAISKKRIKEHQLRAAVWSRSGEKSAKLALIHACSRCEGPPDRIELVDVEFGIKLANYLTRRLLAGCDDHVSENATEANSKRLLALIPRTGAGITLTELGKMARWMLPDKRRQLLDDLYQMGLVEMLKVETATKHQTRIRRV